MNFLIPRDTALEIQKRKPRSKSLKEPFYGKHLEVDANIIDELDLGLITEIAGTDPHKIDIENRRLIRAVTAWLDLQKNAKGASIKSLDQLESAIIKVVFDKKILFVHDATFDAFLPHLVTNVELNEGRGGRTVPTVSVSLQARVRGFMDSSSSLSFGPSSIKGRKKTVVEILAEHNAFLWSEDLWNAYTEDLKIWETVRVQMGALYHAKGQGILLNESWYSRDKASLDHHGETAKVVIDDPHEYGEVAAEITSELYGEEEILTVPDLPILKVFHLQRHEFYKVHIRSLTPYPFDPNIFSKVVLPEDYRDVLGLLTTDQEGKDDVIRGKAGGVIILCTGKPGTGKAQPLSSTVHTAAGPKLMGEIRIGDLALMPDGSSAPILGIYPQGNRPVYEITFSDGRKVKADEDHIWKVKGDKFKDKRLNAKIVWDFVTTKRLYSSCLVGNRYGGGFVPTSVPLTKAVGYEAVRLPIDPWLLGFLIGDGAIGHKQVHFSTSDTELVGRVQALLPCDSGLSVKYNQKYDYRISRENVGGLPNALLTMTRDLGLYGCEAHNKFIPSNYMRGSADQRRSLVQGLMDSDGTAEKTGGINFFTCSSVLARQMQELIWSLGGVAKIKPRKCFYTYKGERKIGKDGYTVRIRHPKPSSLFTLKRKQDRCTSYQYEETLALGIENVEYVGEEPTQCILVDHPDHLYLTDGFVVTHNTLSAEVYAEGTKKPLYTVQCSQLGTNPDVLEKSLGTVLERAVRWKAILLIDEADVYIHERGSDLSQNAVVGVFLRLLEYYDGILFMNTNREVLVDDAIMSRVTAHLKFAHPDEQASLAIWDLLLKHYGVQASPAKCLNRFQFMSGRRIRNIVRLASILAGKPGKTDPFMLLSYAEKFQAKEGD